MKLLDKLLKENKLPVMHGDPVDLFKHLLTSEVDVQDMDEEQVELLLDVMEGLQVYCDDYCDESDMTNAEKALNFNIGEFFKKYNYRPDRNLNPDNLEMAGEEFYEYLVGMYEN